MVLTVKRAIAHLRHSLGGSPRVNLGSSEVDILNQAGEYLVSAHTWKWLEDRSATLDVRGQITVTASTYTQSTKTLVAASGTPFSSYTRVAGDRITIVSGTGVDAGKRYTIASTNGTTNLVLEEDLGTAADGQTDISFTVDLDTVALPSDFSELIAYNATDSLVQSLELVSHQRLLDLRTSSVDFTTFRYAGAITWFQDNTTDRGVAVPLLEIWPLPTADDPAAFTIVYRAGWSSVSDDQDQIPLPQGGWLDVLYLQLVTACARGWDMEDQMSMSERLAAVIGGPLWKAAVMRDARIQVDYGPIQGSAISQVYIPRRNWLSSTVGPPT